MRSLFPRSAWLASAFAVCVLVAGLADAALAQSKKHSHRSIRQGMFALSQLDSAAVVMLGDSLTEGAPWGEITGCPSLANRAIGGDDSAGVRRRLDAVTSLKPSAVILMIGVNDLNSGVAAARIVDNVQETIDTLKKAGARVYLTLVLPVGENFKKINGKIDDLNRAYIKLAKEEQVTVIDFRADMTNDDGFLKEEFNRDGIHLTPEGYRVWRDTILPVVQQHCAARMQRAPAAVAKPPVSAPKTAPKRVNDVQPTVTPAAADAPTGEFNTRFGPWR